jgi:hypothetical protein
MPGISIFLSDDDAEWLAEKIGKGNVSSYIQSLIQKDKGRIEFEHDKKTLDGILNLALFFVGLAFILLVVSTNFFPGIGSFSYVVILIAGGVLLTLQSGLRLKNGKVKKNGINYTDIRG